MLWLWGSGLWYCWFWRVPFVSVFKISSSWSTLTAGLWLENHVKYVKLGSESHLFYEASSCKQTVCFFICDIVKQVWGSEFAGRSLNIRFLSFSSQDSESLDECIQAVLFTLYRPFQATSRTVLCQVLNVVEHCYKGDSLHCLIHFLLPAKQLLLNLQEHACVSYLWILLTPFACALQRISSESDQEIFLICLFTHSANSRTKVGHR